MANDLDDGEILELKNLHRNHPGMTENLAGSFCEAARVCLSEYHASPTHLQVEVDGNAQTCHLEWEPVDQLLRNSQANRQDAPRDGAYAISLFFTERRLGLVAIARAEEGSGADWYVAPIGEGMDVYGIPDLDNPSVRRLEVSGQMRGPIGGRMTEKLAQLSAGKSGILGLAAVVGFQVRKVRISHQS